MSLFLLRGHHIGRHHAAWLLVLLLNLLLCGRGWQSTCFHDSCKDVWRRSRLLTTDLFFDVLYNSDQVVSVAGNVLHVAHLHVVGIESQDVRDGVSGWRTSWPWPCLLLAIFLDENWATYWTRTTSRSCSVRGSGSLLAIGCCLGTDECR